jgi:ATPase subunit of ABC transporter with duplicated ATPase domains
LTVEGLSKTINGEKVLDNVSFTINKGDKIAFVGSDGIAKTTLFKILMGELDADEGTYKWGITTSQSYFPADNSEFFNNMELTLVDWLRQYSIDKTETFIRGFLGRMLFSGEEALKEAKVLSGGEKVRCMLSKMMLSGANVLILDEPTNHLDLESITAVNNGLINFGGTVLFTSHDHQFTQTIANRIIEITPAGLIDKQLTYDEYLHQYPVP